MQNQTFLQKIGGLLNTSSETFMLIALVSLFVIPVVIAQNIEPVVDNSVTQPTAIRVYDNNSAKEADVPAVAGISTSLISKEHTNVTGDILGLSDSRDMKLFVTEDTKGMTAVTATSSYAVGEYAVNVINAQKFNKTTLFKIKNTADIQKVYNLDVITRGDAKVKANLQKVLYVDATAYEIGSAKLPTTLTLNPSQEVTISLISNKTSPTNITISVKLAN